MRPCALKVYSSLFSFIFNVYLLCLPNLFSYFGWDLFIFRGVVILKEGECALIDKFSLIILEPPLSKFVLFY